MYFIKSSPILKKIYPKDLLWNIDSNDTVYLSFDDGPHPEATPFVLRELEKYDAKATFFCIGKNVIQEPQIYQDILLAGHRVGNHTFSHVNGWEASRSKYLNNIAAAKQVIDSQLFRPPYGRIRRPQAEALKALGYQIVMWDVLSGDFDTCISPEKCWENIVQHIEPGSIVVFHDSSKAWERLQYALPRTLAFCKERQWKMASL